MQQSLLLRGQLDVLRSTGANRNQIGLVPGCDTGAGDGHLAADSALFHQAVQFPGAATPQELHELSLRHPAFVVEGRDRGCRLLAKAAAVRR